MWLLWRRALIFNSCPPSFHPAHPCHEINHSGDNAKQRQRHRCLIRGIFSFTWWYVDKIKFETEGWLVRGGEHWGSGWDPQWCRNNKRGESSGGLAGRPGVGRWEASLLLCAELRVEDAGEACRNACRRGLIPGFCPGPNQLGGRGQLESGWPGGRRVMFTCGRYFLWEVIRLGEGKCSVPGECRGARKMTPRTRKMTPPLSLPPTHIHTHTTGQL